MGTTQPIRSKEEINQLKEYFLKRNEIRNYTLIVIGMNLPLRISDLLSIRWRDVYDVKKSRYHDYLQITEQKTAKRNLLALNSNVLQALELLKASLQSLHPNQYLFSKASSVEKPLSRVTAYLIIHNAANELGLQNIGCHSLRKTFGYHAWKQGVHLGLIMAIYNHSSIKVTQRYLGIEQEDKDTVFHKILL